MSALTSGDNLARVAAISAEVARADGTTSGSEKQKFVQMVEKAVPGKFNTAQLRAAFEAAQGRTLQQNLALVGQANEEEGRKIIRVGIAIGGADGNFDDQEREVVGKFADELWLDRPQFGL